MVAHTEFFAPGRFTAGALIKVAAFGMNDAAVALRKRLKARVAVTLTEAFFGHSVAMDTVDLSSEAQLQAAPQQLIQRGELQARCLGVRWQPVTDRCFQASV